VPQGSRGCVRAISRKSDIVKGLRLIIGSNTMLAKRLQHSAHHAPVSKAKVKAATAADTKGNRDLNAGSKLLKLQ
jgi:hypothetical protein